VEGIKFFDVGSVL